MTTVQLAIRSALEGKKASVERAASHDMQHWGRGVCDNLTSLTDQKSCLHALHNILVEKQICAASQCTAGSWTLDYLSTKNIHHRTFQFTMIVKRVGSLFDPCSIIVKGLTGKRSGPRVASSVRTVFLRYEEALADARVPIGAE